jgi:hypothetical protein
MFLADTPVRLANPILLSEEVLQNHQSIMFAPTS